ncbi:Integrase catalytic region (fragment) [Rhizobium mesoamericanum STM3625]|uniref:Integrase catalytic region n=1 Tax=Rhizobium mesoamericanum STM3625 TaxID=1211777 RepID=K0PS46_9HYPH
MIVSDNGSEFTSNAILQWTDKTKMDWHYIAPGKPIQNAFIESFNGRLRNEFSNENPRHSPTLSAFKRARRLQRSPTALRPRLTDTCRVRCRNGSAAPHPAATAPNTATQNRWST